MIIPQEVYDLYNQTVRDMNNLNFGVNCLLTYPEKRSDCPNCIFDPLNKKSSNQYTSSGPIPFATGLCPYCNGIGYLNTAETESIKMRVYFDKRSFAKFPTFITVADGHVMSIGNIEDISKVMRAVSVVFNTDIVPYKQYTYILDGEPVPFGIGESKEFAAIWHRI